MQQLLDGPLYLPFCRVLHVECVRACVMHACISLLPVCTFFVHASDHLHRWILLWAWNCKGSWVSCFSPKIRDCVVVVPFGLPSPFYFHIPPWKAAVAYTIGQFKLLRVCYFLPLAQSRTRSGWVSLLWEMH